MSRRPSRSAHRLPRVIGVLGAVGIGTALAAFLDDGDLVIVGISAAGLALLLRLLTARGGGARPSKSGVPGSGASVVHAAGADSRRAGVDSEAGGEDRPFLAWTEAYSVGVPAMDRQHKRLVELVNRLHRVAESGEGPGAIRKVLNDIAQYADFHFSAEARLMEKHGCPELGDEKVAHGEFIGMVKALRDRFTEDGTDSGRDVPGTLRDRLVEHIQRGRAVLGGIRLEGGRRAGTSGSAGRSAQRGAPGPGRRQRLQGA